LSFQTLRFVFPRSHDWPINGEKVFDAVEHVVTFGLEHRVLGQIDAIGVEEIQYAKGHKYLTLVYQIDLGITRLLWVGKERTIESFQGFFNVIGEEIASKIVFVCSDMWEPYLKVNGEEPIMRRNVLEPAKKALATRFVHHNFEPCNSGQSPGGAHVRSAVQPRSVICYLERKEQAVYPLPEPRRHVHRAANPGRIGALPEANWKHGRYAQVVAVPPHA
jgi:hypothetical protein